RRSSRKTREEPPSISASGGTPHRRPKTPASPNANVTVYVTFNRPLRGKRHEHVTYSVTFGSADAERPGGQPGRDVCARDPRAHGLREGGSAARGSCFNSLPVSVPMSRG